MELANHIFFLILLSLNNDLFTYVFATDVGCKIRYLSTTELKYIPYITARVAYTINFSVKKTWILITLEGSISWKGTNI